MKLQSDASPAQKPRIETWNPFKSLETLARRSSDTDVGIEFLPLQFATNKLRHPSDSQCGRSRHELIVIFFEILDVFRTPLRNPSFHWWSLLDFYHLNIRILCPWCEPLFPQRTYIYHLFREMDGEGIEVFVFQLSADCQSTIKRTASSELARILPGLPNELFVIGKHHFYDRRALKKCRRPYSTLQGCCKSAEFA